MTFSQTQCAADAAPVDVKFAKPTPEQVQAAQSRADADAEYIDNTIQARQQARAIAAQAARIAELEHAREAEIRRFKNTRVNNNQAGATYLNAMANKLQATTSSYNSQIEAGQRALERTMDNP